MGRRARWASISGIAALLTLVPVACGTPQPTPAASTRPTAATVPTAASSSDTTPEPTAEPTESLAVTVAPSVAANTFVSEQYKYAITLPPGAAMLGWHAAERPWDLEANFDMAGPYPDRNLIAEGGLYVFGAPTTSLDEFYGAIEANGTRHRCTEPENRREGTIGDAAAIGFTQVCDGGTSFARVVIFKDGYGIAMFVNTPPGGEVAGRDRAFELLEGLEWRTG